MRRSQGSSRRNGWQAAALALVMALARVAAAQQAVEQQSARVIVVSVADRKLALVENGEVVRVYPVAVGARVSESPTGAFKIVNRVEHPTYYRPHKVIGPGPENPLGTRWIGLDQPHYGIHGTNEPWSIGKAASHGCIRMAQRDLEELFSLVRVGDTVEILGERNSEVARIFGDTPAAPVVMAGLGK